MCAPTGAGKTNIAMLAVIHEIKQHIHQGVIKTDEFKVRDGHARDGVWWVESHRIFDFKLFYLFCVAFSLHIFIMCIPHCKYFFIFIFLKFLHPEFG